ncbi:MAG: flagellar biosynthetic protein FliO [Kangiellaceae bacterium]|jgi:flagellar protein FliO/FliZ|nr:flagellar biosynthetic protein FliO [Kangiellaceae bacterium]
MLRYFPFTFFSLSVAAQESKIPEVSSSLFSVFISLVIVLLIILICAWFLRKLNTNGFSGTSNIELKASHMLGSKERLVIVKVDGKHLLLGVTPSSITKIDELSSECCQQSTKQIGFQEALSEQIRKVMGKANDD